VIKNRRDSLARVEQLKTASQAKLPVQNKIVPAVADTQTAIDDSTRLALLTDRLGAFGQAGTGTAQEFIIENDLMKVTLTTKGGRVKNVELKNYKTSTGKPVRLFVLDSISLRRTGA
jgi:YidC/Oxa1 family membrane protein insertase